MITYNEIHERLQKCTDAAYEAGRLHGQTGREQACYPAVVYEVAQTLLLRAILGLYAEIDQLQETVEAQRQLVKELDAELSGD